MKSSQLSNLTVTGHYLMCRLVVLSMLFYSMQVFAGGVESGDAPYERCALCHGLFGVSAHHKFPHLAGQNPYYLEKQLAYFLEGARKNDGGQMQAVVTEIERADFAVVVEWFASQESPEPSNAPNMDGEALYTSVGCQQCHTADQDNSAGIPLLAAQHKEYLAKQMREFRDGVRPLDGNAIKLEQLTSLTNDDIELIAEHLASLNRTIE